MFFGFYEKEIKVDANIWNLTFDLPRVKKGKFPNQFITNDDIVIKNLASMIVSPIRLADCIIDMTKPYGGRRDGKLTIDGKKTEREIFPQQFFQPIKGNT